MGGPSVSLPLISCLFTMPFKFGYVQSSSGLNKWFKKNVYINTSSDNLTKSFMIHEMYGCQGMILKEIKTIFVYMIICSSVGNLINTSTRKKRNKY